MTTKRSFVIIVVGIMLSAAFASIGAGLGPRGPVDDTDSEPNDSIADATNIASNSITIPGTLNSNDNSDVYKIMLDNDGSNADTVTILADFNTSTGVSIEVVDEKEFGYYYGFDNNADNKQIKVIGTVPQYFYINLSKQFGDVSYSLSITKVNSGYTGNANNDPTQAPAITQDKDTKQQTLDGNTPLDQQDFYKISLTSSGSASDLFVAFLDQPDGADYWLEFYKSAGGGVYEHKKFVKAVNPGDDIVLSWGTTETADYYLRIYANSGQGQYTLITQKTSVAKDTDNTYDAATPITLTNHHTWTGNGELGESIDSEDWYSLPIVIGQFINASITSLDYDDTTGLPDMYLQILATNHLSELPGDFDNELDPDGFTNGSVTEVSGTNYLKVYVLGGGGGGRYSIDLLTDKPPKVNAAKVVPVQIVENSIDTTIKLNEVFTDPDTDPLAFTYEKLAGGSPGFDDDGNLSVSIGGDGTVTITPKVGSPNGWTGSGILNFTAKDPYGLLAYAEFTISVKGTNHAPYVLPPYDATLSFPEDIMLVYDEHEMNGSIYLNDVFSDNDTGDDIKFDVFTADPLWITKQTTTNPITQEVVTSAAVVNNSFRIVFAKDANNIWQQTGYVSVAISNDAKTDKKDHDAVIYFQAIDNGDPVLESARVKLKLMIRSPGGNEPEWKATFTKVTFDEDNKTTIDLDDQTKDVDKVDEGALQYDITGQGDHITVKQLDRSRFEFSAEANWNGKVDGVNFTVTDTFGLSASAAIQIEVRPLDDPPAEDKAVTSPDPIGKTIMDEGSYREFTVGFSDPDGSDVVPILEWYLDDDLVTTAVTATFNYTPDHSSAGDHVLKVVVKDDVDPTLGFNVTWAILVNDVNRVPTGVKIISPDNNVSLKHGAKIEFKAQTATDPDGDPLNYTWYADGDPIPGGGERTFEYNKLKSGQHTILLEVTDGRGGVATDEIAIKIKKKPDTGPGFEAGLLLTAFVLVGLLVLRKRR